MGVLQPPPPFCLIIVIFYLPKAEASRIFGKTYDKKGEAGEVTRREQSLERGQKGKELIRRRLGGCWQFCRYETAEEEPSGLESGSADDSGWKEVELPHDWGIEGPFQEELPGNTGKRPWHGIGWYRKRFTVPDLNVGERLLLEFEGAMSHPQVWLNGVYIGEWAYGYNSFILDGTAAMQPGQTNELAVRLDNPPESSRWYPGGGLYRDVWVHRKAVVSVDEWSTFITTPRVTPTASSVEISTTVRNAGDNCTSVEIWHTILGPDGSRVATVRTDHHKLPAGEARDLVAQLEVPKPMLWDSFTPALYTCHTEVRADGVLQESKDTCFGIRSIEWRADDGLHLNGRRVQVQGVCQHHDLGALGGAFNRRAAERQLERLLQMGCNAIRMAHNPPAPELLDLCDRMGILVVNELFDTWKIGKTKADYGRHFDAWHERDVRNWVCRDRNHPSVIAWSLGNEIREQEDLPGNHDRARRLVELCRLYDPTRPTTVGMNDGASMTNGFAPIFDLAGYNYRAVLDKSVNYQTHLETLPRIPLYGAETSSCLSTRGVYFFPVRKEKSGGFTNFQVSSYDLYAPLWGYTPDIEFDSLDRFPAVAGEFVWTGFDYLGEPTPYNTDVTNALNFCDPELRARAQALDELQHLGEKAPSRSSYFGIIDLAGFPKDRYYLYQARWRPDLPVAHLLPHWNWPGREGEITPVHAYTNGDEAELLLNGKSLGRKSIGAGEYRFVWEDVRYASGKLELIIWRNGKPWATAVRETSGPPARLRAIVDRNRIRADGKDLAFATVEVLDDMNRVVPDACPKITCSVEGAGELVATDNGDPTDWTSFQSHERRAFNGLALAIIRGRPGMPGKASLIVSSQGLASTHLFLDAFENPADQTKFS
ncbi:MAG: beta-galactosidase GalB [Puniceicoccaceae bacterium]